MTKQSLNHQLLENISKEKQKRTTIESQGNKTLEPNLKSISDALDQYFFVNKLSIYCAYLSYKNIVREENISYNEGDLSLIQEIISLINNKPSLTPTLTIYNNIRFLLEQIQDNSKKLDTLFSDTVRLINEHTDLHIAEESLEMFSLLNNFCIRKINDGQEDYKKNFLKINVHMINIRNRDSSLKEIFMEPSIFRNIVAAGISIEEASFFDKLKIHCLESFNCDSNFDWLEKFIAFFKNKLGETTHAKFQSIYCQALLEFTRANYAKAYKVLNNPLRIQGTFLNLDIKMLHLKILYEVNIRKSRILEYDKIEINKVLDSYRKLISYEVKEKKNLSYQIPFYRQFEKIYRQLFYLYINYSGRFGNHQNQVFFKQKEILEQLINENNFSYNSWFIEKMNLIK